MFYKTVVGNYPRPDWLREELLKIEGKQKKVGHSRKKVEELYSKGTAEVMKEFESSGLDLLTDGHLKWSDALAYFCEGLNGFKMTGLIRFYDNNFYYRQPEVVGKISWVKSFFTDDFNYARKCTQRHVKCVLPGPYTLARLCKNSYYSSIEWLMVDLASAIAMEASALAKAGCRFIQIDEPSLVHDKEIKADVAKIKEALEKIESAFSGTTMLYTYFGGFNENIVELLDSKFDVIGFDFVEGKNNIKFLKEHPIKKDVALGLINARDILMEKPDEIKKKIRKIINLTSPKDVYVNPNWGLELIPREYALKKLRLLLATVDELKEEIG